MPTISINGRSYRVQVAVAELIESLQGEHQTCCTCQWGGNCGKEELMDFSREHERGCNDWQAGKADR
jgi:hypothetical protein